jgi:hypothetical protein
MGATNFGNITVGRFKSASQAYDDLVDDALYEYGHGSYNGTISTTIDGGFIMEEDFPRYQSKAFDKWEDKTMKKAEKWGPCICIELTGAALKRIKENHGYKGKKGIKAFYFFGWAAI